MHAHWNGSDTWSVSPQVSGKPGKNPKFQLGVSEAKLGSEVQEATNIPCVCNEFVGEVMRGLRLHISRFLKGLEEHDMTRSQLGLAHSYSRAKVGFMSWCCRTGCLQLVSLHTVPSVRLGCSYSRHS